MNVLIVNITITKYAFVGKNAVDYNCQQSKSLTIKKTIRLKFEKFVI